MNTTDVLALFHGQGGWGVRVRNKYIYIIMESCASRRSASGETDAATSAWSHSGDVRRWR